MKKSTWLWPVLGVATAVLTLLSTFLIMRFAPSPIELTVIAVAILLVALAVFGFVGTRRGHAATFVTIALVLPYLLLGTIGLAGADRASSEIDSFMDDSSGSDADEEYFEDDDDFFDDESSGDGTYGSDPDLDALYDDCASGDEQACEQLYLESPAGSEYEMFAEENGGGI